MVPGSQVLTFYYKQLKSGNKPGRFSWATKFLYLPVKKVSSVPPRHKLIVFGKYRLAESNGRKQPGTKADGLDLQTDGRYYQE